MVKLTIFIFEYVGVLMEKLQLFLLSELISYHPEFCKCRPVFVLCCDRGTAAAFANS